MISVFRKDRILLFAFSLLPFLANCGAGICDGGGDLCGEETVVAAFTSGFTLVRTNPTMTLAKALHPETLKKGTGWEEIPMQTPIPVVSIVKDTTATIDVHAYLNRDGCNIFKLYYMSFKVDISRDGGATYSTSYVSDPYRTADGGSTARFMIPGIEFLAGEAVVFKLYTTVEEGNLLGADPNTCLTKLTYFGTVDLLVDPNYTHAVKKPEAYAHKWTDGFTLYDQTIDFTTNPAAATVNYTPGGSFPNGIDWIELSVPVSIQEIQLNTAGNIRTTLTGTIDWTGCSIDFSASAPPLFQLGVRYQKNGESATRAVRFHDTDSSNHGDFTSSAVIKVAAKDSLTFTPIVRFSFWSGGTQYSLSCINQFRIRGTLRIENFPLLEN